MLLEKVESIQKPKFLHTIQTTAHTIQMVAPSLLASSEIWMLKWSQDTKLVGAEMKYCSKIADSPKWECVRYEDIRADINEQLTVHK